jgi:hypothetical protein
MSIGVDTPPLTMVRSALPAIQENNSPSKVSTEKSRNVGAHLRAINGGRIRPFLIFGTIQDRIWRAHIQASEFPGTSDVHDRNLQSAGILHMELRKFRTTARGRKKR